jgi:hypothetical protein
MKPRWCVLRLEVHAFLDDNESGEERAHSICQIPYREGSPCLSSPEAIASFARDRARTVGAKLNAELELNRNPSMRPSTQRRRKPHGDKG